MATKKEIQRVEKVMKDLRLDKKEILRRALDEKLEEVKRQRKT